MNEDEIKKVISSISNVLGGFSGNRASLFYIPDNGGTIYHGKMKYDEDIKFSYYGDITNTNNHDGVMVVASVVNKESKTIYYGVSYCSPKDSYNKMVGKQIAYKNLVTGENSVPLVEKRHHEINSRILSDIFSKNSHPSWAKGLIIDNLYDHLDTIIYRGII